MSSAVTTPLKTCPTAVSNMLGYRGAGPAAPVVYGGTGPLRLPSPCPTDATQCVTNLAVRDSLYSQTHVGGTLTLTGTTTQSSGARATEAALFVQAGASIAGRSSHGELVVTGGSTMGGPLAVNDLHGPVRVSNPAAALTGVVPAGPTLSVSGPSAVEALAATDVSSSTLTSAAARVAGLDASPAAVSNHVSNFLSSLVTVVRTGAGVTTTQGVVVRGGADGSGSGSSTAFVITNALYMMAPGAYYTTADTVTIVTAAGAVVPATVTNVSQASGTAFLVPSTPGYGIPTLVTALTAADLPAEDQASLPGLGVWIPRYDSVTGSYSLSQGVVSHPSVQLLSNFSSAVVTLTSGSPLVDADMGSPVFVASPYTSASPLSSGFQILSLLQHGCPGAATAYGATSPALAANAGGIKAPALKHIINQFTASASAVLTLPILRRSDTTTLLAVGVSPVHRAALALQSAGVIVPGGTSVAAQTVSVVHSGGAAVLGSLYQNLPSVTDVALSATRAGAATFQYTSGDTTGATSENIADFESNTTYFLLSEQASWLSGTTLQSYLLNGGTLGSVFPGLQLNPAAVAVSAAGNQYSMVSIDNLTLPLAFGRLPTPAYTALSVVMVGTSRMTSTTNINYVAMCGTFTAVNNFLTTPAAAGALNLHGTVLSAAWSFALQSPPAAPDTTLIIALAEVMGSTTGAFAVNSSTGNPYTAVAFTTDASVPAVRVVLQTSGVVPTPFWSISCGTAQLSIPLLPVPAPLPNCFSVFTNWPAALGLDVNLDGNISGVAQLTGSVVNTSSAPAPVYI